MPPTVMMTMLYRHMKHSWLGTRPVARALWMFAIGPGLLLGLLVLRWPDAGRGVPVIGTGLAIAAQVWIRRQEVTAPPKPVPGWRGQRAILILLVSAMTGVALFVKYAAQTPR